MFLKSEKNVKYVFSNTGDRRMSQWLLLTIVGSYDYSSDHLMPWIRCWSWRSFHVAWTTATHFSTAHPMDWWPGCSRSRMLLHVSCRALNGMTTQCQCYTSTPAALASGSEVGGLQDSHLGLLFVVRHGSGLPGRWLSAVIWRGSSSAAFCRVPTRVKDLYRQANLHLVSKKLCQCYFVNNSMMHWPNLIIFGMQHRKETWHKRP